MSPALILAAVLLAALIAYVLFAGADFGGGVWDLLASGPRRSEQRKLIEDAIAPIWEANHVWLIFAAVLLFGAFPRAFAVVGTSLHIPLTIFLIGIVFRGSAFAFRSYDARHRDRWGRVFSIASVISPFLLGTCVAALASGRIRVDDLGVVRGGFVEPWTSAFAFASGAFNLALCAFLAAVYLAYEAKDAALKEDFRRRALSSAAVAGAIAFVTLGLSRSGAPRLFEGLTARPWTWPFHAATALCAVAAIFSLWKRRFGAARIFAAGQVALVLLGWAVSQYPLLIVPDVAIDSAGSNPATLRALLWVTAAGVPILGPSLYLLFRIFKGPAQGPAQSGEESSHLSSRDARNS